MSRTEEEERFGPVEPSQKETMPQRSKLSNKDGETQDKQGPKVWMKLQCCMQ